MKKLIAAAATAGILSVIPVGVAEALPVGCSGTNVTSSTPDSARLHCTGGSGYVWLTIRCRNFAWNYASSTRQIWHSGNAYHWVYCPSGYPTVVSSTYHF